MSEEKPSSSTRESRKDVESEEEIEDPTMDAIRKFFAQKLGIGSSTDQEDGKAPKKVIDDLTFNGLTEHWKKNGFKKVITMVGAGISTSAGIPDFRSPGSGLYDNLQKYNLPHPTAIFDLDYFEENPKPFFALAKELYPGTFIPTISHYFVRLLSDKGLLVRHYTQNIDTLERIAGIPEEKLVEAHGTFYTNHCLGCRCSYSMQWMKEEIFADRLPKCEKCKQLVKPDIVFFGENLPEKFYSLPEEDFKDCDLLIIMGTSLEVHPFASLVDRAGPHCIRLLINRTKVGNWSVSSWLTSSSVLKFDNASNTRDIAYLGDCDDGITALAEALGWSDELNKLAKRERARLDDANKVDNDKECKDQKVTADKCSSKETDKSEQSTSDPEKKG